MRSPWKWCMLVAGLVAAWSAAATAQEVTDSTVAVDDGNYQMMEPFGEEPAEGIRFQADALLWTRSDSGGSGPIIGGPQSFSLNGLSNGYVGGYRIGAAWLIDPNYEFEGVWTTFADWTADEGGVLTRSIAFNGGVTSPLVDPSGNANFVNTGTYFRPIFDAAMDPLANPAIQNYAFLRGGSTYTLYSESELHDVQANFKTRRSLDRRISWGVGYRNIRLDEGTTALVTGEFGTNDLPAGGNTFNILTNEALVAHGLSPIDGAADGWTNDPADATTLSLLWNGTTSNQLNGVQGTIDASLLERGNFALEGIVRAGLFYNRISGTVQELYAGGGADNSVYGRSFSDERDVVSFASNLGLNGLYRLNDYVRIRAGYEVMFLTNTAVSGDQQGGISYNGLGVASYSVQSGSSVVLHGLRGGVEVVW